MCASRRLILFLLAVSTVQAAPPSVSQEWARATRELRFDSLTPEIRTKLIWTIRDCLGVLAFASRLSDADRYRSLTAVGGSEEATEFVRGERVPLAQAAAINAFLLHSHEIDDSNLRNQLRASCVALPAVLAVAESRMASGQEFLTALAASYHVSDRLGLFLNEQPSGRLHRRGWMPSSVCGGVGAAAGAGKAAGLSESQLASALGFAATGANGLFQYYEEGTDEKRVNVARSQAIAIESILLARAGFTGARGAIEGKAGLCAALGFPAERGRLLEHFARFDGIQHIKPKFYSCSQGVIPWIEALAELRAAKPITAEEVRSVILHVDFPADHFYLRKINQFVPPDSVLAAQLSVNFGIALYLLRNSAFVDDYTTESLRDEKILALARAVRAVSDREHSGRITVVDRSGAERHGFFNMNALNRPYVPVEAEYVRKFDRLTARLTEGSRRRLWALPDELPRVKNMAEWSAEVRKLLKETVP